ncbi:MAG: DUF6503 family protein [Bacteroidota bacterium]
MEKQRIKLTTSISLLIVFIGSLVLANVSSENKSEFIDRKDDIKAKEIIELSIEKHGGGLYKDSFFEFDFRGKHFTRDYKNGDFRYIKTFYDSSKATPRFVEDILTNEGFNRYINGKRIKLSIKYEDAFRQSVNSVIYFTSLPFGLSDDAVNAEYIGEIMIKDNNYHKIKVTFNQEGGGDDFQDSFFYWINSDNFMVDYVAYQYHVNGGGIRFREAINRQNIKGITFQDYVNYEVKQGRDALLESDVAFENGQLKELSRIINENIEVRFNQVAN